MRVFRVTYQLVSHWRKLVFDERFDETSFFVKRSC